MPKVLYGNFAGESLDFRDDKSKENTESTFKIADNINGKPLDFLLTWHGYMAFDNGESIDIIGSMSEYLKHTGANACCGRCVQGKKHTVVMADMVEGLREDSSKEKIDEVVEYGNAIIENAKCYFAPSSVKVVLNILSSYPDEVGKKTTSSNKKYTFNLSAPCTANCPSGVKIPQFIDQIRSKNYKKSLAIIRETMPFAGLCGRICPHPCEDACLRGDNDKPVNIMALKQSPWNDEYFNQRELSVPEKAPLNGKRVGIVGAGPAGLAAAYYLLLEGFEVDIYDRLECGGGMVAKGIPSFREPTAMLQYEIDLVVSLGVKIHYNTELGKDIHLEKMSQDYDAVLLAIGAWLETPSGLEGVEGVEGVASSGIEYLKQVADGKRPSQGDHAITIGAGNTAMDCARVALRVGSRSTIVYRRTEKEMPALKLELLGAKDEGVNFTMLTLPLKVVKDDNNKVIGLECVKMELGEPDASGRRSPVQIEGSNFIIDCSYIIPAIGQKPDISHVTMDGKIKTTKWDTFDNSQVYCQTAVENIFAAGDCLTGPDTVVTSVGSARWASRMISRYLLEGKTYLTDEEVLELAVSDNNLYAKKDDYKMYGEVGERIELDHIDMKTRVSTFDQFEKPMDPVIAIEEAKRCMRCMRLVMAVSTVG